MAEDNVGSQSGPASESPVTQTGLAVALVIVSRFLAGEHSAYLSYLKSAAKHAASSGLQPTDVAFLDLLIRSTGQG